MMKLKVFVFDTDYDVVNGNAEIRLYCKDSDGRTVLLIDDTFKPYFFILPKNDPKVLAEKVKKITSKDFKILDVVIERRILEREERDFLKVVIDNPRKIAKVRDVVKDWEEVEETYEYNISFYKRYLIDNHIFPLKWYEVECEEIERKGFKVDSVFRILSITPLEKENKISLKVLAFDTEFVEENGEEKLIMLSVVTKNLEKVFTCYEWEKRPEFVESVKTEKDILRKFMEVVEKEDPDIIVSYNGDDFDFKKLKEVAKRHKMKFVLGRDGTPLKMVRRGRVSSARMKGRVHIDLYRFIDNILSPHLKSEVLTLDQVSQELLGVGKKEMDYEQMVEIWSKKEHMERLVEYNLWDSRLTFMLSEQILPQVFAISSLVGEIPFDSSRYTYSQLVEAFLIRKAFEDGRIIPNSPKAEEKERRMLELPYKGAIVIEPKRGIHSNLIVLDFKSLYPTIICTHNVSPETINCGHESCKQNMAPGTKYYFCKQQEGFIPKHLKQLISLRKRLKEKMKKLPKGSKEYRILDNQQYAVKIISNSVYGYLGFVGARWYKRACGSAVAAWGRYYITKSIEEAKKRNYEIIYGDTDSLMIRIPGVEDVKELEKIGKRFAEDVNKLLPGIIELEYRGLYRAGIFVARKRGEAGAKKRYALLDLEGNLEIRGFETVRRDWCLLAKEIQRRVLEIILKERDPEKAVKVVRETIKKIKEGKVSLKELTIFEQITRPLSQYKQIGPHVKAAKKALARGLPVVEGSVIGFVITKGSGSISDRAEPVQFVSPRDYDPDYYIHHQILPAAMRVLKALGISEEYILSGAKSSLRDWIK